MKKPKPVTTMIGRGANRPGGADPGSRFVAPLMVLFWLTAASRSAADPPVLKPAPFAHYVQYFNTMEDENVTNFISNANSWDWLQREIPLFECPDRQVEEMYYFRWWSFRKHLERTPDGFVFTEFLTRPLPVSSALGHQIREARWLHDQKYLDDDARYWLRSPFNRQQLHKYSNWLQDALYQRYLVTDDKDFLVSLLGDLTRDYAEWEQERLATNGLFWQYDVRDAMEESISGSRTNQHFRPSINSYMFGNARALAAIARLAGNKPAAVEFDLKAARLKRLVQEKLWNPEAKFFEVLRDDGRFADVREETGFIPWMFELPEPGKGYEAAWSQFTEPRGFAAPCGITTAERRHPQFRSHGYGHCEWDGAVWPFATSQTLTALANVLHDYPQNWVTPRDYYDAFLTYVRSQHADGKPFIGEYLDEITGQWINGKGGRSRFYNHSTFADLLITGVVGLCPRADNQVDVRPLLPEGTWDWFCLDGLKYHGRLLTVIWDKDGQRYGRGRGLMVLADGKEIAHSDKLESVNGRLP
ncbi:MAG TPA: glycosyl hydrolase family 65 protein [Candidatus Acidoferrum sp.]|nr:glycosyl hydrolase family 65 protein [Candidatus Acidoferrum sp.]